ncbi:AlkZ-related protein [Lachnospiraceae bacterium SGI.085]
MEETEWIWKQEKHLPIEYGWDVAVYSSIEHIYGYDYVTSCYKDNPQDSWKQIVDYMRKMYPQATDKKIRKILK